MIEKQSELINTPNVEGAHKRGLANSEVIERRKKYGFNKLPEKKGSRSLAILLTQFKNPLIYIISVAAIISIILAQYEDALIIIIVIVLDCVVGFFQEYRAQKTVAALRNLLKPTARVIRDGNIIEIDVAEIVPDDLVSINPGDKVSADGVLIEAVNLSINESILTGESESIVKAVDDKVFMGTSMLSGRGLMKVTSIGTLTELGKIAGSLAEIKGEITPLQVRLEKFGKTLTIMAVFIALFIFITGILKNIGVLQMLQLSVVLAIAAIPASLLIAVTMILVIGMHAIVRRKGLAKNLLAVETLGSVTTICTDKTGTLTEGIMQVARTDFRSEKMAAYAMALCNNLEDSLEVALWNYVKTLQIDPQEISDKCQRVHEVPFSSEKKYMFTSNMIDGTEIGLIKGAPDIVLDFCTQTSNEKQQILAKIDEWAIAGLKLLGLAYKKDGNVHEVKNFTWVGLIGIEDPVRPTVKDAITLCRRAGIKVKMITGDYRKTAEKVASILGLAVGPGQVLEGKDLEVMSEEELTKVVQDVVVFCRVSPQHKLKIVTALQNCKEITAMIGDGVNDAPALKKANIGVSVGGGTDVAQETAGLILLDSNFKTLVDSVEEGRIIFDNIKKVVAFVLSNSFAEILLIFFAFMLGWPAPLTVVQILWIYLICDGPSDIALGFERGEKGIMDEPPKSITENIIDGKSKVLILAISSASAILSLILFRYFCLTVNEKMGRTIVFTVLSIQTLLYIFSYRSLRNPIFKSGNFFANKPLIYSVILGIGQVLIALYIPFLSNVLDVTPLGLTGWTMVILVAFSMIFIVETVKFLDKKFRSSPLKQVFSNIQHAQTKLTQIDNLHNISVDIMKDKTLIQFHFDISPETHLDVAHELASHIEEKIKEEFPINLRKNLDIISHIEPTQHLPGKIHNHSVRPIPSTTQELIEMALKNAPQIKKWDHLNVIEEEGKSSISLTIYLEGTINIAEVHHITEDIEAEFRKIMPHLKLCVIHSAPFTSK